MHNNQFVRVCPLQPARIPPNGDIQKYETLLSGCQMVYALSRTRQTVQCRTFTQGSGRSVLYHHFLFQWSFPSFLCLRVRQWWTLALPCGNTRCLQHSCFAPFYFVRNSASQVILHAHHFYARFRRCYTSFMLNDWAYSILKRLFRTATTWRRVAAHASSDTLESD
eukprot:SAG31_NODE_1506_length_8076_cov_13.880657_3_plen_166_part_00